MKDKFFRLLIFIISFISISIILKKLISPYAISILAILEESINTKDNGLLVIATIKTILYEVIIDLPVFLSGYCFTFYFCKNEQVYKRVFSLVFITSILYFFNRLIFDYKSELLLFILILICEIIVFLKANKEQIISNIIILIQLVIAFYGISFLTLFNGLGIGHRDLVTSIKISAEFLRANAVLNFTGVFIFISLMSGAFFLSLLNILYSKRLEKEKELRIVKLVAEEAQVWRELHYLVHDLKSPLMTIAGLNSLVEMQLNNPQLKKYCSRIDNSIQTINAMISEFLNNEKRITMTVEQLINYVRAHVVIKNEDSNILFKIEKNLPKININRVRMARALINIIENALIAVNTSTNPLVCIKVCSINKDEVLIIIEDNGVGISSDDLKKIWNIGFTTKENSHGLGMSFAKKVIEDHQGEIKIYSKEGEGTKVTIILPGVDNYVSYFNNRR